MKIKTLKGRVKARDVFAYLQGHIVYYLYYSMFNFLIPNHIKEQIKSRISSMNLECYLLGNCVSCGCKTTHLQMSSKSCDRRCYPRFLSRTNWKWLQEGNKLFSDGYLWSLDNDDKFIKEV